MRRIEPSDFSRSRETPPDHSDLNGLSSRDISIFIFHGPDACGLRQRIARLPLMAGLRRAESYAS
jgi:hypothetical protein